MKYGFASEEWRDISGYEGLYQVSDMGRVKSLSRMVGSSHPLQKNKTISERLLKPSPNKVSGHMRVNLSRNGTSKMFYVHRLVLETFSPIGDTSIEDVEVRHVNDNPADNRLSNLQWGTRGENMQDRIRNGIIANGKRLPHTKLSADQVREIKLRLSKGEKHKDIAEDYPCSSGTVSDIGCGKSWRHVL